MLSCQAGVFAVGHAFTEFTVAGSTGLVDFLAVFQVDPDGYAVGGSRSRTWLALQRDPDNE